MKIYFATPAYRGIQCPQFLDSLEQTIALCKVHGYETVFATLNGNCYIQAARNELVHSFMESGADVLFFLDDDVSWPAEAVIKLLSMYEDVVAGVYPKKSPTPDYPVVISIDESTNIPVQMEDGSIKAPYVPTGFLKITRDAIEQMIAAYPERKYVEYEGAEIKRELYDLFPQGIRDGRWWGEDFGFCHLWAQTGGEIWIVPDITFGHHSADKTWAGNYHQYLMGFQKEGFQ